MKYKSKIGLKAYKKIKDIPQFKMTRAEYRNEYLQSPEWKALRQSFLKNKDGLCEKCCNQGNDVHHTKYLFNLTDSEQKQRLMLLCRPCHNLVHDAMKYNYLWFPHQKEDVLNLDEKKIKEKVSYMRKKHLVSMMLIGDIVKNNTVHGINLACGVLKLPRSVFYSIPPNLKATGEQIERLKWIAKTKPTSDGWKLKEQKNQQPKISRKQKEKIEKLKIELGIRQQSERAYRGGGNPG
jgi:5-methylcytosine-specific restriction endonuclease McrA